jgi:hypothetical protein
LGKRGEPKLYGKSCPGKNIAKNKSLRGGLLKKGSPEFIKSILIQIKRRNNNNSNTNTINPNHAKIQIL